MRNFLYLIILICVLLAWWSPLPPIQKKMVEKVTSIVTDLSTLLGSDQFIVEPKEGGACNLEFINGNAMGKQPSTVKPDSSITLKGWAMDTMHKRLPDKVIIRFSDSEGKHFYGEAKSGLERTDVANYFSLEDMNVVRSGFKLFFNGQDLPPKAYSLAILLQFENIITVCNNGREVILED